MLFPQQVLFLFIGKGSLVGPVGIGRRPLTNAASPNKDLRLKYEVTLAGFALDVINRVLMLNIGIETENHRVLSSHRRIESFSFL